MGNIATLAAIPMAEIQGMDHATLSQEHAELYRKANRLKRSLMATLDYEALLIENKQNSFYDRIKRGMSPWGAQTSRYAPEEADEE